MRQDEGCPCHPEEEEIEAGEEHCSGEKAVVSLCSRILSEAYKTVMYIGYDIVWDI